MYTCEVVLKTAQENGESLGNRGNLGEIQGEFGGNWGKIGELCLHNGNLCETGEGNEREFRFHDKFQLHSTVYSPP